MLMFMYFTSIITRKGINSVFNYMSFGLYYEPGDKLICDPRFWATYLIYTLGHKLGTTKFEMENIFYITLFSC
jgi:fatty-acid desaturase